MTTGAPARPLAQTAGGAVIGTSDDDSSRRLLLEMASKTKIRVARDQHLVVHRPVRIVARRAAFADRFVFKNKRPPLSCMTLATGVALH